MGWGGVMECGWGGVGRERAYRLMLTLRDLSPTPLTLNKMISNHHSPPKEDRTLECAGSPCSKQIPPLRPSRLGQSRARRGYDLGWCKASKRVVSRGPGQRTGPLTELGVRVHVMAATEVV